VAWKYIPPQEGDQYWVINGRLMTVCLFCEASVNCPPLSLEELRKEVESDAYSHKSKRRQAIN
jgi:hypothetical protein